MLHRRVVVDRQQAGDCVPVETQKTELLRWEKTRFLVVDNKANSRKKLERYLQKREAFFLRGPYDEEIVQIEDSPNPSRMKEGLQRLRH